MKRWTYTSQDWVVTRLQIEGIRETPWQIPLIIGILITAWCLNFGLVGGRHHSGGHVGGPTPPDPIKAGLVWCMGGIPSMGASIYLYLRNRALKREQPGCLTLDNQGLTWVDADGFPISYWRTDKRKSNGSRLEGLEWTEEGLTASFEKRARPVPSEARADIDAWIQAQGTFPAQAADEDPPTLEVVSLEQAIFLRAKTADEKIVLKIAGLVGAGYFTLIVLFGAGLTWAELGGGSWQAVMGLLLSVVVFAGFVRLVLAFIRSFPRPLDVRFDPDRVRVRCGENGYEWSVAEARAIEVVPTRAGRAALRVGLDSVADLSTAQAKHLVDFLCQTLDEKRGES